MTARRFEAASTPAALEAVRAAFGDEAFILSNRRCGERVEIIATGSDPAAMQSDAGQQPEPAPDPIVAPRTARLSLDALVLDSLEPVHAAGAEPATSIDGEPEVASGDASGTGAALAASEALDARLQRMEVALWGRQDTCRAALLSRLLELGLGAATAVRLAEQAQGGDDDTLMRDALTRLRHSVPVAKRSAASASAGSDRVRLLCGPDSDARLAALLQFASAALVDGGAASVALVSADARRAGAFSMLEECARALGCVTLRARAGELDATVATLSDKACVLIDGGDGWPDCSADIERLLVLPATLQRSVCGASISAACAAGAVGCLVNRLESAGRPGECLEALIEHWLPVVWWNDSLSPDVAPRRADAAVFVAACVAAARRLGGSAHDRLLGSLLHPGTSPGFSEAIALPGGSV